MDRIVYIGGKPYLLNVEPFVPKLPDEPAPSPLAALSYVPPISAAAIVKEDRREEVIDLGRLILNGADLDARRRDAEKRGGN